MSETSAALSSKGAERSAQLPSAGVTLQDLANGSAQAVNLNWGAGFRKRQVIIGWSVLGFCLLGIVWGSLPGHGWLPRDAYAWEIAVCLGVSLFIRFLCGLIIYEYEGFQVAAALVAHRKIAPDIEDHAQENIRSIQAQGALESMFGGRQLILVSTVLLPTVVEAAFYPLLPSFQVADPDYYPALAKVTVKTFSFAVLICIVAQLSSQIKAIGGPIAWMRRRTTKYVIKSVGFAEKLGLIIPSRSLAYRLSAHHDLDGQPGTVHEWANWWSEKFAANSEDSTIPPPFLLSPDHESHIMPHKVLNYLLDHKDDPLFYERIVPSFISASIHGLDGERTDAFWTLIDRSEPVNFPGNKPFVWRTGADSLGHIPPHHMIMVLFSSSLLILKNSASPDHEIERLFEQFAEASFGETGTFRGFWSDVRKFRIGDGAPLVGN